MYYSVTLKGRRIIITAGATREYIDPVRYITNASTGRMGVELAKCVHRAGADVLLIAANPECKVPHYLPVVKVGDTVSMLKAVEKYLCKGDIFIPVAAVSDFVPKTREKNKIKKGSGNFNPQFVHNKDIIEIVREKYGNSVKIIGFAAETEKLLENAIKKLSSVGLFF